MGMCLYIENSCVGRLTIMMVAPVCFAHLELDVEAKDLSRRGPCRLLCRTLFFFLPLGPLSANSAETGAALCKRGRGQLEPPIGLTERNRFFTLCPFFTELGPPAHRESAEDRSRALKPRPYRLLGEWVNGQKADPKVL